MKPLLKTLALIIGICSSAIAANNEQDAAIHIAADRAEVREQNNVSIYTGNVNIRRGSINISGDRVTIKSKPAGELKLITVTGKPARFTQLNDQGEQVEAESETLIYHADSGLLKLKVNALLSKNQNQFSSQHIIYDSQRNIVKAGQGKIENTTQPARVQITIQPDKNNKSKE